MRLSKGGFGHVRNNRRILAFHSVSFFPIYCLTQYLYIYKCYVGIGLWVMVLLFICPCDFF